ncbi:lytic polysaccharide monooxygenase auxiliary activity family 9 protein [Catelliglobosispora koreensis]|uniref:lytic polysaccharide monooxygenase auxiliary activity family 9 protein n=1 Tax=Catelliglobosispora koreensis TaxID=129052 RepID=UPI0003A6111E|nr:lytic polysaccharide monooxygenase [Catelliglobosispora koreensis]
MKRLALALVVLVVGIPSPALAHGTMVNPVSRAYTCYKDNPERPSLPVCRDVVGIGGTQPLYDWNEVNIANAAGNHRSLIPDGRLCSAGRDKYRGLDLARADWPAQAVSPGPFTFRFIGTAPHRGSFELYLTRDGYNPLKPLAWSDLEAAPFLRATDPPITNGVYSMSGALPSKSGRHLLYVIWQRSDSPEAFYSCSDLTFGGNGTPGQPVPPASPSPSPSPTGSPASPGNPDACLRAGTGHIGHGTSNVGTEPGGNGPGSGGSSGSGVGCPGDGGGVPPAAGAPADDLPGALPQTGGIPWRWGVYGALLLVAGLFLAWFAREKWTGRHRAS